MANIFYLKEGDTYPNISTQLSDEVGPVNLTGCSVLFRMSQAETGNLMVEGTAVVLSQGVEANWGKCYYEWETGNTDIIGTYKAEWKVTFPNGKIATFPRGRVVTDINTEIYNQVIIEPVVD